MPLFAIIIALLLFSLIGFFMGNFWAKICQKIINSKIDKNAKKVLNGELPNTTEIDGKTIGVYKFVVRDENNKDELLIDFKGEQ